MVAALAATALLASSNWGDQDASQWTGHEAFEILHNSPWSKKVKMKASGEGSSTLADRSTASQPNSPPPPSAGGMGRHGMGRSQTTYSSGSRGAPPSGAKSQPAEVTAQWQSALVVRMAEAKVAGDSVDAGSFKPLDEYVIAVIGLPITALGGRAASLDSDTTSSLADQERIADSVKTSAALLRSGHDPLKPTKVELDQGKDGRMLVYFSKSDPISISDKSVEFHLPTKSSDLRVKFPLKDMEYQGKLQL
jgi:hypothetical protein